ncbi:hypothetical protein GCM10009838_14960 [Catenulispora subtropica]|uniref:Fibronectin type-III domain-containing protein n=2 Tax=Catenulispora subtropica TaxID=450798 RepID=A0ABN2QX34_9ACTN
MSDPDHPVASQQSSSIGDPAAVTSSAPPTQAVKPDHVVPPKPLKAPPKDDKARGMVYAGLTPAAQGTPCVGMYQVSNTVQCSHGPDAPPSGLDVHRGTQPVITPTTATPDTPTTGDGTAPAPSDLLSDAPPVLDAQTGNLTAGARADSAPADTTGAAAAPAGGNAVVCDGDGVTGNRVQVIYMHGPDQDRFAQYLPSFKKWAADTDAIYNASAAETGGVRHIRYATAPDCTVAVLDVEVPAAAMTDFSASNRALAAQGYNRRDRKYMVFADAQVYCGIGTFAGDERAGQDNWSNFGPSYGRSDNGCWTGSVAAHELGHNLGAVNDSAPHSSKAGHCVDEWDIMCYSDSPDYPKMQILCSDQAHDDRLDCNHDDYYNTAPQPGSYLATHWNVANNQFLIAGDNPSPNPSPTPTSTTGTTNTTGGPNPTTPKPTTPTAPTGTTTTPDPTSTTATGPSSTSTSSPGPNPTSTKTPGPSTSVTATTTAGPTGTGPTTPGPTSPAPPPTGPTVNVGQIAQDSVTLSWQATPYATGYDIRLNGRLLGTVQSTVVRVVRMTPDTAYSVTVAVHMQDSNTSRPGRATAFRTLPVTGAVTPDKPYLLLNSLTGLSADLWGGSTRDGNVLISYQRTGATNQQWHFHDAGNGTVQIVSVRSGKCLQAGGQTRPGQYVVQQHCDNTAAAQRWKLTANSGGYTLSPNGSTLVLGISTRWYYGGRLLELQQPSGGSSQNWTVQPSS